MMCVNLLIVGLVCYLCYFGSISMVSFVNVAEMICFDAVKANVIRMVTEMKPPRQLQHLCSLYNWLLPLPLLLSMLVLVFVFQQQPHHANDLCNPIRKTMNIALNEFAISMQCQ